MAGKKLCYIALCVLLILTSLAGAEQQSCSQQLGLKHCRCEELADGVDVKCLIKDNDTIASVLQSLSASSVERIHRVRIEGCDKPVMHLQSLPGLKIQSLEIRGCGIKRVHENAFNAMAETLEEINLNGNQIDAFPNLKNLRKLNSINLNNNLLKDIPEHAFDGLNELHLLRLKHNRICHLLPNALNELKSNLQLLDLGDNCFSVVPYQNLKNFKSLTHLSLADNHISDILPGHFTDLPNLIELRLNANRIRGVSTNAFINVPKLKRILVSNNQLQALDNHAFHALKDLELVDLSWNDLQKIPSFKDNSKLEVLHMDGNKVKRVEVLSFSANPKLNSIYLRNNTIASISSKAFALPELTKIDLTNNNLEFIERDTFTGAKKLTHLTLQGNAIADVHSASFSDTPDLSVVDLSRNKLPKIHAGTFSKLKLYILDLSDNLITTFERNALQQKVLNLLIDGNPLNCGPELDWFTSYLVKNGVRVFRSNRPVVMCATPAEFANVPLKNFVLKKANQTFVESTSSDPKNSVNLLSKLLPGLNSGLGGSQMAGTIPALNSITQALPAMREIPGLNFLNQRGGLGTDKNFNAALEKLYGPLTKFATGNDLVASDVDQLIQSIPNLVVNLPGFGAVDISKLPPTLIEHVLRGGPVPGVPRETLDTIVKQYMIRMYYAAARAQNLDASDVDPIPEGIDHKMYLPPLSKLPQRFLGSVMKGEALPNLNAAQTEIIKKYYYSSVPVASGSGNITDLFSPKVIQMMKLLPPGYDLSKIPPQVMKSVMAGEMPDFFLLPPDLQQHLKDNLDTMFSSFDDTPEVSIEDILKKLPRFGLPSGKTTSPYDINTVEPSVVNNQKKEDSTAFLITAIVLGLVGSATAIVLIVFCYNLKASREASLDIMT